MKNFINIFSLSFLLLFTLISCEDEDYEFGDLIAPSNLEVSATITGVDSNNPYGDGSGEVKFSANAQNAITYKFIYGDTEVLSSNGTATLNFSRTGVHNYTVTVLALGTGGISSSKTIDVEVLTLYSPPADLLQMLVGDGSRTWRIKNESAGHFGVGPADETSPIWWAAAPGDKEGLGAYDDRWIFNADGTYTHQTNGSAYGKAPAMNQDIGDPGLTPNADDEYENYPLENYSGSWTLSAPGGQETLTFSGIGYHGFYVGGDHSYPILSRSENEMMLKTVGADGNSWFVILIAE